MKRTHRRNAGVAATALLASSATLLCCVLPAMLVSIGAGAVLVSLVTAVPQLVWLSEQKLLVFGIAGVLLLVSGASLWHARTLPCPTDPSAARACIKLRAAGKSMYVVAVFGYLIGVVFAFVLPQFG